MQSHQKGFVSGLNHLGLVVQDMNAARQWFVEALGLRVIEDRGELLFLAAGDDVLAIKTPRMAQSKPEHGGEGDYTGSGNFRGHQHLDHYGFFATSPDQVDDFAEFLRSRGVEILKGPYDRRDGRSVYFRDPCGMVGEYFFFRKSSEAQ